MPITNNVYIDKNSQEVIQQIQSIEPAIAHAVYPQYGVPGLGCHHRILCSDLNSIDFLQARKEMWEFLGLLRLIKPLPMHIAGTIEFRNSDIFNFETIWQKTYLNTNTSCTSGSVNEYEESDINLVCDLWKNQFSTSIKETRLMNGVQSFIRTTLTEQIRYSETYFQKLFPILDLLMGNPHNYHSRQLADTIGPWLQYVYETKVRGHNIDFTTVLINLWDSYRHYYLHKSVSMFPPSHLYTLNNEGNYKYNGKDQKEDSRKGSYALHEIVRLTLLALLFLAKDEQEEFNNLPLVENHKSRKEKESSDSTRENSSKSFFQSLTINKVIPSELFWIDGWHGDLFSHFS